MRLQRTLPEFVFLRLLVVSRFLLSPPDGLGRDRLREHLLRTAAVGPRLEDLREDLRDHRVFSLVRVALSEVPGDLINFETVD